MNEIEMARMWIAGHESLITWGSVAAWIMCAATEVAFRISPRRALISDENPREFSSGEAMK